MAIVNFISTVWSARILEHLQKSLVYGQPGVVNRDYEGEISAEGDRVHIHSFDDVTVADYVKNTTEIDYEELSDSRQTLLIDQSKYFAFKVDDVDNVQSKPKLLGPATQRASYQLAEVADRYLASLTTSIASFEAASQATAANIYQKLVEAKVVLDEKSVPAEGRFVIFPPWVAGLALQSEAFLAASRPSTLNGAIGQVAGFEVLGSNNVHETGTTTVVSHVVCGHSLGWTYAEQIGNVEALRLENAFADGVRGLHLYGARIVEQDALHVLRLNP